MSYLILRQIFQGFKSTPYKNRIFIKSGPNSKITSTTVIRMFSGVEDRFKGVTVDSEAESCLTSEFSHKLAESMDSWTESGKRNIWFKVALKDSAWVPILAEKGFKFHHAREGFVMMYKWIPRENDSCNVPPCAHTNLGVGAIVINDQNQILAISEKYLNIPHWKLPGGYVEMGEDITDAAVREVKEETNIDTKFHSIVAFRHAHKMMFDNSDIYMIVRLTPTSSEIKTCNMEISRCQWMDVDEYLNHENVHSLNKQVLRTALNLQERGIVFKAVKDLFKLLTFEREFTVYSLEQNPMPSKM